MNLDESKSVDKRARTYKIMKKKSVEIHSNMYTPV